MKWLVAGLAVAAVCALLYGWVRRHRSPRHRMISFVALLREPMTLDPVVLAKVAGKAWNADLGDGTSEGADGFIVCSGAMNMIQHDSRMFLINSVPSPYINDPEAMAENIPDLRIRSLLREHQAWFSCDALGVDSTSPEDDVLDWRQRLGKLFAEFLDEDCLLIYAPDSRRLYPINEETISALRSNDPLKTLDDTLTVPIIGVGSDDPLMSQAVENARRNWPQFVAAYEARTGENFSVKAPIAYADHKEFIWISVTALEGDLAYGTLANEPGNLGSLKLGSKVSVPVADLNDWCYIDSRGDLVGGFTIEAVQKALQRRGKKGTS